MSAVIKFDFVFNISSSASARQVIYALSIILLIRFLFNVYKRFYIYVTF